jgi:addiction module RelB/DinJ family antitoxin
MATTIQMRIDEETKTEATSILADMGIDITTAFRMFLKEVINERALPFRPKAKSYAFTDNENRSSQPRKPGIHPATSDDLSWLDHPWKVKDATPMTRDEMYDRV